MARCQVVRLKRKFQFLGKLKKRDFLMENWLILRLLCCPIILPSKYYKKKCLLDRQSVLI
jgi:hypothetical protein